MVIYWNAFKWYFKHFTPKYFSVSLLKKRNSFASASSPITSKKQIQFLICICPLIFPLPPDRFFKVCIYMFYLVVTSLQSQPPPPLFVHACVQYSTHACVCTCLHVCVWRPTLEAFSITVHLICWGKVSYFNSKLPDVGSLAIGLPHPLPASWALALELGHNICSAFECWRSECSSSCLPGKHFTYPTLPCPSSVPSDLTILTNSSNPFRTLF